MNRKKIILFVLMFFILAMVILYFTLKRSHDYDIEKIEISIDDMDRGDIPNTTVQELSKYYGQNLLFVDKNSIERSVLNNPLIESIQIERVFPKKLRIYLKKTPVNVIITYNERKLGVYSIFDEKLVPLAYEDIDCIDPSVVEVSSDIDSIMYLNESKNMKIFLKLLDVLDTNSYLISSIKYYSGGLVGTLYFDVYLDSLNAVLRFRESFDEESFELALNMAKQIYKDRVDDKKIKLDIYHGSIVERQ
jgi:hypothetical protein